MRKHCFILFAALLAATAAVAQVSIDQAKAMAGQVTPGDAPGFPITLSQSGSYKLTGNLVVPAGSKGIEITAPNVTLDLNGFTVKGPSSCTRDASTRFVSCTHSSSDFTVASGIDASGAKGAVVRNGNILGFAGPGINAGDSGRFDSIRAAENGWGIIYTRPGDIDVGVLISNAGFDTNRLHGAYLSAGLVHNSRASHNGGQGFQGAGPKVTISDSQALANRGHGLSSVSARGTVTVGNAANNVFSMGGNMNDGTPY